MNIQQKLLPLIENVDYSIQNDELIAIPKTRQVEQQVPHSTIIPAEFDAQGVEISPQSEIVTYESVFVTETYTEQLPSLESVKLSIIDIAIAVGEYLADKTELRDLENDSINIVNNTLFSFNFKNVPHPSNTELIACFAAAEAKKVTAEQKAAALKFLAETDYLIIREMDARTPCPAEIKQQRAAARLQAV
jgi:hypothetical protein